jgi:1,4-dihydroxy-2-naphthoyl-CoA hydrolase
MKRMDFERQINASMRGLLPDHLGMAIDSVTDSEVTGRLTVTSQLCTSGEILHGGAIMAFADTLGAVGAFVNLSPGTRTSTVESKTNFVRAARLGETVTATSRLLNKGRTLMLWQTEIRNGDGKLIALVTQSQIIMTA